MNKNQKIILIFILIIVLACCVTAYLILKPADLEERSFQNFNMLVPSNEEFNITQEDYSIHYIGDKDTTIQYFMCNNLTNVLCYSVAKQYIVESSVKVNQTSDNITEWKMETKNQTRYICLKEAATTYGACIMVTSSNKDLCMRMAQSIQFTKAIDAINNITNFHPTASTSTSSKNSAVSSKNNLKTSPSEDDFVDDYSDFDYDDFDYDSGSSNSVESDSGGSDSGGSSSGGSDSGGSSSASYDW